MTCLQLANQIGLFFASTTHCEPQSGCFIVQLPRRILVVSFVCTGWGTYLGACLGSVFQEQAPSCVLVGVLTRELVSGACFKSKLPRVYWPRGTTEICCKLLLNMPCCAAELSSFT